MHDCARCEPCAKIFAMTEIEYRCPQCGGNLDPVVRVDNPVAAREQILAADWHMGRYAPLVPLDGFEAAGYGIGGTPLLFSQRLGREIGAERLYFKDETGNPSASLKDRASIAAILAAQELGRDTIATASTGNAAASLAAFSARRDIRAVVFAPRSAPVAKLRQIQSHGATLYLVDGSYDDAYELCAEACDKFGWFNRSTGLNPFTIEGKKTVAFEIAEQLGWVAPELVVVPTGDGNILSGVHKGFSELLELGWIDTLPRLLAVQAAGSPAIHNAMRGDQTLRAVRSQTIADSISVDLPRDGERALRVLRACGGASVAVEDSAITRAVLDLAEQEGIFAEPAAAASIAGLRAAVSENMVDADAVCVALITGHGLKDRDAAADLMAKPSIVGGVEDIQ